ncbi:MAG TPA: hypothetical protein VFH89_02410 [Sphingomicrobium sp.]|nr:hypothetical protein [Sphingomicrobium sp.]
MNAIPDEAARADRLYQLIPAIHRIRDAERGYPLKALLAVIAEQVNVVEDDIYQLYDNWFIETAEDWAVPYIGDLLGYVPPPGSGLPPDKPGSALPPVLVPRREIANTIRMRRAKGTLALLEELAFDVAGWPGRAVEYFKLLNRTQHLGHLWPARHSLADLRDGDALDRLGGPFAGIARCVDTRRLTSPLTPGRHGIPAVALFVWRLRSFSVTDTPAQCIEEAGPHCFTFSILGQDAPLFVAPAPEPDPSHIAGELNRPGRIRRRAFDRRPGDYYGQSLSIDTDGWAGHGGDGPVPLEQIIPVDLSGWTYLPAKGRIAVDPVLGRIAFPPGQLPKKGVRVRYHYGFPGEIGGGEYPRPLLEASAEARLYTVAESGGADFRRIGEALARWQKDNPKHAVIEIRDSGVYVEPVRIELAEGQTLQLRAASRRRPVIRLIDWQADLPDALLVTLGRASRIAFDGLLVTGRPIRIEGVPDPEESDEADADRTCLSRVDIRHCTLVPGWGIDCDCAPRRPAEASLELTNVRAGVRIAHSILGTIQVREDQVKRDPIPITISDCIVDATGEERQAIGAPGNGIAHAVLTVRDSTVFGIVEVHAMKLGENSLFTACVHVARRQIGCLRYSYVPSGCRTPRRYRCQPDGVVAAVKARKLEHEAEALAIEGELIRVRPQFTSRRYGNPAYAQLGPDCADEIVRGADDESEMGVWHDLYQPQRRAALSARISECTPAGMDAGIIFAN